jgi:Rps23 Pro-64 3,4-dihydroxylase Tpa1-like proline 4-hydroxylase
VIDNFFNENFLNNVSKEFPDLSAVNESQKYENKDEVKFANNDYLQFPSNIKKLIDFMNSKSFLNFLQNITSIKEKLIADPELNGGGLHEIKSGGYLKIHTDFNKHPNNDLDRRINILIYLNKNWKSSYGGDLQLWDKDMLKCQKKILPMFNRMVIFSTNDYSNHGHPDPIVCPNYISRKSIALYYFSKGRPVSDIKLNNIKNKTYFKNRLGYNNETTYKKENIKNFLRKLKIYQTLKNLEKKYFRKRK